MTVKLTKPQQDLLADVVAGGGFTCVDSYPPARKLIALGLIKARTGPFGTYKIEPTDAGRDAVTQDKRGTP